MTGVCPVLALGPGVAALPDDNAHDIVEVELPATGEAVVGRHGPRLRPVLNGGEPPGPVPARPPHLVVTTQGWTSPAPVHPPTGAGHEDRPEPGPAEAAPVTTGSGWADDPPC